jgi:hypothetical protein
VILYGFEILPKCKKLKVKREYSVKIFSFFLEKKVAKFWEERLECFSLHLDSDFSLVTFFELFF